MEVALTQRLYLEDSYCRSVAARVVAMRPAAGNSTQVALDQTCFYPTGGGQPADAGLLGGLPVQDVTDDGEHVWHTLPEPPAGDMVQGELDWARRFDHMQQHSGQHVLSAVALDLLGAQTTSFHLGTEAATIDLDIPAIPAAAVLELENAANSTVLANLPVLTYAVAPEDVSGLGLRKPPTKGAQIRIVEVQGVDRSACGGTHVRATGEIGAIKIRRVERYKGGMRVEFLCGWRALRDYQWKHQTIACLARDLSVADRDLEVTVRKALASEREAAQELERLRAQLLEQEAAELFRGAECIGPLRVVARVFPERSPVEVKQLASRLTREPSAVALFAALKPATRLFFMRSADAPADMRQLLKSATDRFGGGGGGRPESAEGGGMPAEQATSILDWAIGVLLSAYS
ncbi:MAG: alanyl-tRNA editing protein [Anaerolineae bacterium]